jgi:hypothetical protein
MILTEYIQHFQFCRNVKTIARALQPIGIETCSVIRRRMRSMLENLMHTLPTHRHRELRKQLERLNREIEARYPFAGDRALARIADPQGLGGRGRASGKREANADGARHDT